MPKLKQQTLPPIAFTKEGYEKVKKEYEEALAKRIDLVDKVRIAREMGDLSENAAYHEARKNLFDLDRHIRHLKMQVVYGKVEETKAKGVVTIGSTVTVKKGRDIIVYQIVGDLEANPYEKKISPLSPIGKALLGRKVNEKITIEAPAGKIVYTIVKVK